MPMLLNAHRLLFDILSIFLYAGNISRKRNHGSGVDRSTPEFMEGGEKMSEKRVRVEELPTQIDGLCGRLKEMGYAESTISGVRRRLKRYADFMERNNIQEHDSFSVQKFVIANYGDDYQDKYHCSHISRPLAMLEDYLRFGVVMRQKYATVTDFSDGFAEPLQKFMDYLSQRNYAKSSLKLCRSHLLRFQEYLRAQGVQSLDGLTHELVRMYGESLASCSTGAACQITRNLKNLLTFARIRGMLAEDFTNDLPHFKNTAGQRLPDRFTEEEIGKILEAIDRNHPLGKRDYAIVLTAVRLGLRNCDVISLKFGSLDWAKKELRIVQKKTGVPLALPLPDDVGWAIIDYVRNARPDSDSDSVFVSFHPPYRELTQYSNYVVKYLRKAGIYSENHRRAGMGALRRSLATSMLENNIPVTVIAQTLGHGDLHTVGSYIRISLKLLRQCAMEVDDYE